MITRKDLEVLIEGFGYEMAGCLDEEQRAYDRVRDEFYDQPDIHGWVPVRAIEGEVVRGDG